jgi:hypothetical protein
MSITDWQFYEGTGQWEYTPVVDACVMRSQQPTGPVYTAYWFGETLGEFKDPQDAMAAVEARHQKMQKEKDCEGL